ncbi:DUF2993 domain-containing protein [Streptomyces sp. NPDC005813]|uniref:LmeA family phospholipid-binding protein n=1 Tax=Streptomyces sp. NPDC005813 TaxID=3155592 RepID=UPI0033D56188
MTLFGGRLPLRALTCRTPGRRGPGHPATGRPVTRRRTAVAALTVLALGGGAVTAEAVVRHRVGDRFATAAAERLGTVPDVGLGGTPVLMQLSRGAFPDVELTADGVTARRMTGLGVDVHLRDVRRAAGTVTVGSSTADVTVGADRLGGDELKRMNGVVVPDPGTGRLLVHLGRTGALTVPVTPSLDGTTVRVTPARPTFDGAPLPDALSAKITGKVRRTVELTGLPMDMKPQKLAVTDDGLRLSLRGGRAALDV